MIKELQATEKQVAPEAWGLQRHEETDISILTCASVQNHVRFEKGKGTQST